MAVNTSRSLVGSLHNGMSDGSYRRARPDTEVIPGLSDTAVRHDLFEKFYGPLTQEIPQGQRELPDGTVC
jgi:hypothetical protein